MVTKVRIIRKPADSIGLLLLVLMAACSDNGTRPPNSEYNWPPTAPICISPGGEYVGPDFILKWSSHDPDGGSISYDLYFGTDNIPTYIARTNYNTFPSPWNQQENARRLLMQVYQMQTAYFWQHHSYCLDGVSTYAGDFSFYANLGIVPELTDRYSYTMSAQAGTFTCTASADIDFDPAVDAWTIDQSQMLACVTDDIDSPFQSNTTYYWQVIAQDDHGNRTAGPIWQFRTRSSDQNSYPEVPQLISPPNGDTIRLTDVIFQWSCTDPDGDWLVYYVYLNDSPDLGWYWQQYASRPFMVPPQRMRAKACETLQQIYLLEDAYHSGFNSYWFDGVTACYRIDGLYMMGIIVDSLDVYCYSVAASLDNFTCTAAGNIDSDATYDVWTIDENGDLICASNDFGSILPDPIGTTYYWRVTARDGYGHTTLGPIWTFISEE